MGNKTTVTTLGIGGAITALLFWVLGYFSPDFMMSQPAGAEAALTVIFTAIISFFKDDA